MACPENNEMRSGDCDLADGGRFDGRLGQMTEELISPVAGRVDALGAEGTANALLGERRRIDRGVKKPRPVIIPQVMVRVSFANAKGGEGEDVGWHDA